MNDNEQDSGTRSFETARPSAPKPEMRRGPDPKKIVAIAIFAVIIIIVTLFCAIIITEIAIKYNANPGTKAPALIEATVSSSDTKKGCFVTYNKTTPLDSATVTTVTGALEKIYDHNIKLKSSSGLVTYYSLSDNDLKLLPEVIDSFNSLTKALYDATQCDDVLLAYAYMVPKSSTLECDYPHALGTTVDIKLSVEGNTVALTTNTVVYNWLNENCAKFGFVNSDLSGSVHGSDERVKSTQYRFVGIAHASYISTNSLSVDAYLNLLKTSYANPEAPLTFSAADGKTYSVYYAPASGTESTVIRVAKDKAYSVSGDNLGGFIVCFEN